jgi:hypothetical protein
VTNTLAYYTIASITTVKELYYKSRFLRQGYDIICTIHQNFPDQPEFSRFSGILRIFWNFPDFLDFFGLARIFRISQNFLD